MPRTADHPKSHVLSFRVNATEWQLLVALSRKTGLDVSTLLRQTLNQALKELHG